MNSDPRLQNAETPDNREALITEIGKLLARQASPEAFLELLETLNSQTMSDRAKGPMSRERLANMDNPPFQSSYAQTLLEGFYPRTNQPGFNFVVSGNASSGLLKPALPATPGLENEDVHEKLLDSMGVNRISIMLDEVPSLPTAILDRTRGFDRNIKDGNEALRIMSLTSFKYLTDLLNLPLSERAFVGIMTPLLIRDFWDQYKSDPGGKNMRLPMLKSEGIEVSDLTGGGGIQNRFPKDLARIMPSISKWLRLIHTQATASMSILEGDPFTRPLLNDPSILELNQDLEKLRRNPRKWDNIPLTREDILMTRQHPLRKYIHAIKDWNRSYWRELIERPELLVEAEAQIEEISGIRTILIGAGMGAGKSTLARQIDRDRRLLLQENKPGATRRFLGLGENIIGLNSAVEEMELFKADSPFNLLFSAMARTQAVHGRPEDNLILMEIPPAVSLGIPERERPGRINKGEVAELAGNPSHIARRLLNNATTIHDLITHDPDIAVTSTIALSRIAAGNVESIVLPLRGSEDNKAILEGLAQIQISGADKWSIETTLSNLQQLFSILPAEIKTLWWMSAIANAPLVPMVREFPGGLTQDDVYNRNLGAVHYLVNLHNLGIFELEVDISQEANVADMIGTFLSDGKINLRKLAMRIPEDSPLRKLLVIADHLQDSIHGTGRTNTRQFLYGLAISLNTLFGEKNIEI